MYLRADFTDAAQAYRDGDKALRRHVAKGLRDIAKPLGQRVLAKGAAGLPHRGGLSRTIAAGGKVGVTVGLAGRNPQVLLRLQERTRGYKLGALDGGNLTHPVFARADRGRKEWTWVRQGIKRGLFTDALDAELGHVQAQLIEAAQAALATIARDAEH